jgi:TolB protein
VRQLTKHSAIDTSPSFSPDGQNIVFNSDRSGTQQIYSMNKNGGDVKRISFGEGRYATPVWSPRGDWIGFTRMRRHVYQRNASDGSGNLLRVSWKRYLGAQRTCLMFRQDRNDKQGKGGRTRVFSIDFTGNNEREVVTPLDASDPAWSPLIP